MFKVDLSKFDKSDVKIGDYQFTTDDKGALKVVKNEKSLLSITVPNGYLTVKVYQLCGKL